MKQRPIPKDIECAALGSGCPNNCWYCHEPVEVIFTGTIFTKQKVKLTDMNILSYPEPYKLLERLGQTKKYFELVCGIDYRILDVPMACLLRKYRFGRFNKDGKWQRYIRFAWDYEYARAYQMYDVFKLLTSVGFNPNQIGVFVLVNGKVPYLECLKKLDTFLKWGVHVSDCCYDGGYPDSREDYQTNPKFDGKRFWRYEEIEAFRAKCRKHTHLINYNGIDIEWKLIKRSEKEKKGEVKNE